jgi:hypothetical protein
MLPDDPFLVFTEDSGSRRVVKHNDPGSVQNHDAIMAGIDNRSHWRLENIPEVKRIPNH